MSSAMIERNKRLIELCDKNPICLPVKECAKFIGMDEQCLRESINQGKCKFAVGGQNGLHGNRFAKIPTLAFYNFMMHGAALE